MTWVSSPGFSRMPRISPVLPKTTQSITKCPQGLPRTPQGILLVISGFLREYPCLVSLVSSLASHWSPKGLLLVSRGSVQVLQGWSPQGLSLVSPKSLHISQGYPQIFPGSSQVSLRSPYVSQALPRSPRSCQSLARSFLGLPRSP